MFIPDKNHKYRQDLRRLKGRAISFFDQMMAFDLNFEEDSCRALEIAISLKQKIDALCEEHLVRKIQNEEEESQEEDIGLSIDQLEQMQFSLERLDNLEEEGLIGGNLTSMAIKNLSSYMIGTRGKSLKVIENSSLIFCGQLPLKNARLDDMIYISTENCYLLAYNNKLYRKEIDSQPPFVFMDVRCGWRVGACFRFSNIHQRLIINKDRKNISAIYLQNKEIFKVEKGLGTKITDFRLFGQNEENVVSITYDGFILLYQLNYEQKTGSVISNFKVQLLEEEGEIGTSVAVCDRNQYVLAEIGKSTNHLTCTRMLFLKIEEDNLIIKSSIDTYFDLVGQKLALDCYGYARNHLLWVGLSRLEGGVAQVYDYDIERGELKELEEMRVVHQELDPAKIHKFQDEFYYTGSYGTIMKLSLGI